MGYDLYIGDYAYSSWSLRGWLLVNRFGLSARSKMVPFVERDVARQMADIGAARTVPTLVTDDGAVISESAAIAEELATRHPEAGIWAADPRARAIARTLVAEMATGFTALRSECPMNLRVCYRDSAPSDEVRADLARLETIWAYARAQRTTDGPWLLGEYSAADAFFAPVAARIAGYSLPVAKDAAAYVAAHLTDPAFRRWRAMGLVHGPDLPWYRKDYPTRDWNGPAPRAAKAIATGTPENEACPYSGKAITHVMQMDGRIFGFCNPFCRNKTVADPEAWPAFMALV
ncbi:glutathione S-transferase [Planktotalea arctica]|uniref:glutathione S-transferase n=1 Tax=Planktotalea arctica TaxID=1481893 RepID=UPI000A1772FF|nr:glutathione S-transferase [Planktotalea arctica]